jgi:hypothetical protein
MFCTWPSIPNPVYGKPRKGGTFNAYNQVNSESGMSREEARAAEKKLMMSMKPNEQKAYLAKHNITGKF